MDAGSLDAGPRLSMEGQFCDGTRGCDEGLTCLGGSSSFGGTCRRGCTNPGGFCASGALCETASGRDAGATCLPPGPGVPGSECTQPTQCGLGLRCVRRGTTGPFRCAQGCNSAEGPACPSGQACSTFSNATAGFCEPKASLGAGCLVDGDCGGQGLTCLPIVAGGLCSKNCTTSADCGPTGVCSPLFVNGVRQGGLCARACMDTSECRIADGYICKSARLVCAISSDPVQCEAALGTASACSR